MFSRCLFATASSVAVTFGLFLLMQGLIEGFPFGAEWGKKPLSTVIHLGELMPSIADQIPIAEGLFTWPSNDPRLLGSQCADCGVVTFPAQSGCPACCGEDTEAIELERKGKLWTWTIQGFLPNRPPYEGPETPETFKPFGVGYVELPNQVRVETRIQTEDISKLRIGMEMDLVVEKYIERDGKDIIAYFFRPADES